MRELALAGLIAIAFGLGAYYATDEFGRFTVTNLVAAALLLAVSLGLHLLLSLIGSGR